SKGLKNYQAAGIVGNLIQESSVNPNSIEYGGGPGRGIAQWSGGGRWDSSHNDNMVWYASQHGLSPWSLTAQLDFIWYELTTFGGY
ncbi:phage tail tip lysozyme, partial [Acinetobacter baumannii]